MKATKNITIASNPSLEPEPIQELKPISEFKIQDSKFKTSLAPLCALALLAHPVSAQTWQTVDTYQYVAGLVAGNFGLTVSPSGVVFACGWGDDGTNGDHGLVR